MPALRQWHDLLSEYSFWEKKLRIATLTVVTFMALC
jgi:hypothetical protein